MNIKRNKMYIKYIEGYYYNICKMKYKKIKRISSELLLLCVIREEELDRAVHANEGNKIV